MATFELELKKWDHPQFVYTKEGAKVPIQTAPPPVVKRLIRLWLEDICCAADLEYDLELRDAD